MDGLWWGLGCAVLAVIATGAALYFARRPDPAVRRQQSFAVAKREFHLHREQLEAKFLTLASESGRPRGLRWTDCDFENEVTYARDRETGELSALVAVSISFEAVEGGDMEEVEAVGNLRAATAVFTHENNRWVTHGRAIFNLNPAEAIQYYRSKLERVELKAT